MKYTRLKFSEQYWAVEEVLLAIGRGMGLMNVIVRNIKPADIIARSIR